MNEQVYYCPSCQEPQHLDADFFDWDDDGTARINCQSCGEAYTIARPVSVGFGGGDAT